MQTITTASPATLTNLTNLKQKIEQLFKLPCITAKDIEGLNQLERDYLAETCTARLQDLKDQARDSFLEKIALIVPPSTKGDIWEFNHNLISSAVTRLMRQYGVMPTKNTIAKETGLSRYTVNKHLAAYKRDPEYTAHIEQFKFVETSVLANIGKAALNGDMRAARLYLETVGAVKQHTNTIINKQNNYLQINNTTLSQENLRLLSADQLNQIESIISNAG